MKHIITDVRRSKGVSQAELAKLVGSTQSMIGKLERGERKLTIGWLSRIAEALGVAPPELLDLKNIPVSAGHLDTGGKVLVNEGLPSWYGDESSTIPSAWELKHSVVSEQRAVMLLEDTSFRLPAHAQIIFSVPGERPTEQIYGRLVAAWVVDGPPDQTQLYVIYIGTLMPGSDPGLFHLIPLSGAPKLNARVEYAALVESIELP